MVTIRRRFEPSVPCLLLLLSIILSYFPVFVSPAVVTLDSIEILRTIDWFSSNPTFYFQCKRENSTFLPDVKERHAYYSFKGQESWQPLTELPDTKCKRCGFYEKCTNKPDDVFDEWEFCASSFTSYDGKHIHFKDRELNATFLCPECFALANGHSTKPRTGSEYWMRLALFFFPYYLVSAVTIVRLLAIWSDIRQLNEELDEDELRFLIRLRP